MLALSVSRISSKTRVCAGGGCQHYPAAATRLLEDRRQNQFDNGKIRLKKKKVWTPLFRNGKLIPKCLEHTTSRDAILNERHKFGMIIVCYLVDDALF